MKLRPLIVSVVVLAALSVVAYVLRRPAPPASSDPRIDQPMLASAVIEKTARVHLGEHDKSVDLARSPDGSWRVTNYYDLPADVGKLSTFLGSFTDAKLQRVISNPDRVARLELKDSVVKLADASGTALWSVTLGKNADAGGRFVRFGDEPKAYLANLRAWLDTEPKNWARAELLGLKPDDVARLEIDFADGAPVIVSRAKKEDRWTAAATPAGQQLAVSKVESLADQLASLRFTETADPKDANVAAAHAHERTLKLTTFAGTTYSIALGRKPEVKKPKPAVPAALKKPESKPATTPAKPGEPAKPAEPEFETIPAGPVYADVASSDASAPVNAFMQKRAFEVSEYVFTDLPAKSADLFEPAPAKPAAKDAKPAAPQTPPATGSTASQPAPAPGT